MTEERRAKPRPHRYYVEAMEILFEIARMSKDAEQRLEATRQIPELLRYKGKKMPNANGNGRGNVAGKLGGAA